MADAGVKHNAEVSFCYSTSQPVSSHAYQNDIYGFLDCIYILYEISAYSKNLIIFVAINTYKIKNGFWHNSL